MSERDRDADLLAPANVFVREVLDVDEDHGGPGIDGKRPFGFSGGPGGDIAERLGIEKAEDEFGDMTYSDEVWGYCEGLWDDLAAFMRERCDVVLRAPVGEPRD